MSAKAPESVHTALVHRLGWTSTAGKLAKPALTLDILRRAGVPLHVAFESELPHNRLVAALSSVPLASVTLHHSPLMLHPPILSQVVSALTASAQTLTALRCLPLAAMAPWAPPHEQGLTALTRLRALALLQAEHCPDALPAAYLPASLQELTLTPLAPAVGTAPALPALVAFDSLQELRRITLAGYTAATLRGGHDEEERPLQLRLPPSLEVHTVLPAPAPRCLHPLPTNVLVRRVRRRRQTMQDHDHAQRLRKSSTTVIVARNVLAVSHRPTHDPGVAGGAGRGRGNRPRKLPHRRGGAQRRG